MTVSPAFRAWLASDEATQQLAAANAVECCPGCDIPLTDDVELYDMEWAFSGWDVPQMCADCGREAAGED